MSNEKGDIHIMHGIKRKRNARKKFRGFSDFCEQGKERFSQNAWNTRKREMSELNFRGFSDFCFQRKVGSDRMHGIPGKEKCPK